MVTSHVAGHLTQSQIRRTGQATSTLWPASPSADGAYAPDLYGFSSERGHLDFGDRACRNSLIAALYTWRPVTALPGCPRRHPCRCIRSADLITASTRHEQGLTRGASDPSAASHCHGQGRLHDPGIPSRGLAICAARVGTPPSPASTNRGWLREEP
jgi:hypothetical protein